MSWTSTSLSRPFLSTIDSSSENEKPTASSSIFFYMFGERFYEIVLPCTKITAASGLTVFPNLSNKIGQPSSRLLDIALS